MKVVLPSALLLLLLLVHACSADHGKKHAPHHGYHEPHYHPVHYSYGYKVHDDYHGTEFGHDESREGKNTKGVYHVLLPDGRVQTVKYHVDGYSGYVADVSYSGKPHEVVHKPHYKPHKPHPHVPHVPHKPHHVQLYHPHH